MKCIHCNNEFEIGRTGKKFCNNKCQAEYQYQSYIERWRDGLENGRRGLLQTSVHIIRFIKEKFDNKCVKCGWCEINQTTGKSPLHIDHLNGNPYDNTEENLQLICPNCHSLTPTFGALNKGNGRKGRINIKPE